MDESGVVIDLGSDRDGHLDAAVGSRPAVRRRRIRSVAAGLAAVLVLAAGGSAPPPPPPLIEILTATVQRNDNFLLTSDRFYVSRSDPEGAGHRVAAYDLSHGEQLWASPHRTSAPRLGISLTGGVLLVTDDFFSINDDDPPDDRTTALDPVTGQRRWSVPHWLVALPGETVGLVFDLAFPPGPEVGPPSGPHSASPAGVVVRAVDLSTGRMLWTSARQLDVAFAQAPDGNLTVLVARADGGIELWDARTQAVLHRLDRTDGIPEAVFSAGDLLLVRDAGSRLTAYSADLRQRLWQRPLPADEINIYGCGPMICEAGPTNGDLVLVDPATGRNVWRLPRRSSLIESGPHLLELGDTQTIRRSVEPGSGRTLVDLTGWRPGSYRNASPPLLLQNDASGFRTWLGLLGPGASGVRTLAAVPHLVSSCQSVPGLIACRSGDDKIRVWRYR